MFFMSLFPKRSQSAYRDVQRRMEAEGRIARVLEAYIVEIGGRFQVRLPSGTAAFSSREEAEAAFWTAVLNLPSPSRDR